MTKEIKTFVTPEGIVEMENLVIDVKKKTFNVDVKFTPADKKQKPWQRHVEGSVNQELLKWYTELRDVKIPVKNSEGEIEYVPTGEKKTGFEKWLAKINIENKPGVLSTLQFKCDNRSDQYNSNPFRLAMLSYGNVLQLVNVPAKNKTEHVNPDTGEVTQTYRRKTGMLDGKKIPMFVAPQWYKRLVFQSTKKVEVAEVPQEAQQ